MRQKQFLSEISQAGTAPYILHKIWFGDSFLTRQEIKQNLVEASLEIDLAHPSPPNKKFKKIIWTDHDANEEEKSFAQEYGYEIINLKNLKQEDWQNIGFGADFFKHKTKEGKEYDFLPYIFPDPEELFPDYGRRSDFSRALIIKKFGGLYEDTDDILVINPKLSGIVDGDKKINFLKFEITKRQQSRDQISWIDGAGGLFDLGQDRGDFVVNKNANSIIFAKESNCPQINQVCDRICQAIDNGYEKRVRNITRYGLSGLKRHQRDTVILSGPEAYSDFNQERNDLPVICTGSWLGKNIFDMTSKVKQEGWDLDNVKQRLIGQLSRDARDKLGILNWAKYNYVACELIGGDKVQAKQIVGEAFNDVKEKFPDWQPKELRYLDQEGLNLYEIRKIYKYQKEISDNELKIILDKSNKSSKEESKFVLEFSNMIKCCLKKQDHKTFASLLESSGTELLDQDYGIDVIMKLVLMSSDEIYNSFMQITQNKDIETPKFCFMNEDIITGYYDGLLGSLKFDIKDARLKLKDKKDQFYPQEAQIRSNSQESGVEAGSSPDSIPTKQENIERDLPPSSGLRGASSAIKLEGKGGKAL